MIVWRFAPHARAPATPNFEGRERERHIKARALASLPYLARYLYYIVELLVGS